MKKLLIVLMASVMLMTSGCVTGRRSISLSVPVGGNYPASKGVVSIESVKDARAFQNHPSNPSIPSIDGDVNSLSAADKAVMIGRQRNTYGKALGDIALANGETVEGVTNKLLEEALKKRGFAVASSANPQAVFSVKINDFWAWFTPGMWAVSFEAKLDCTITVRRLSDSKEFIVRGNGLNRGQVASDPNWQLAYTRAFEDFLKNAMSELADVGF